MTLIRFVQRAGILAGITFAGITLHGGSSTAQTEKFCVVASNGKTACGTLKAVERACVNTDNGVVCGKFKSVAEGQAQRQETRSPTPIAGYKKEVNNIVYLLKGCRKSETSVKCEFIINNKAAERNVEVHGGGITTIVDSTGKSYTGSSIDIGGRSDGFIGISIAPEIDYLAVINFENISSQVTKASLLNFYADGKNIQFRNITFSN